MSDWEAICKRCGCCCFEKELIKGRVFDTDIACRYLDVVSRQCKVYEQRLDVDEGCMKLDPDKVREAFWLPADCAYRAHLGITEKDQIGVKLASDKRRRTSLSEEGK